jgi:molecular chaperone DnaK (HSP70)
MDMKISLKFLGKLFVGVVISSVGLGFGIYKLTTFIQNHEPSVCALMEVQKQTLPNTYIKKDNDTNNAISKYAEDLREKKDKAINELIATFEKTNEAENLIPVVDEGTKKLQNCRSISQLEEAKKTYIDKLSKFIKG